MRQASGKAETSMERGQSHDALNGFLRNQILQTNRSSSQKGDSFRKRIPNNRIIEQAAQLKVRGDTEKVLDYVRSASAHTGVPRSKQGGLSKMKITTTQKELDKCQEQAFMEAQARTTHDNFLHANRELHTNHVDKSPFNTQNGDRRVTSAYLPTHLS